MSTKAERFRYEDERADAKKKAKPAKKAPKAPRTTRRQAKFADRARKDVELTHAAEMKKTSPKRRATDARAKGTRARGSK